MDDYNSIIRSILVKQIRHECRFSERQIVLLKWSQISDDRTITSGYAGRRVKISEELYKALMAVPVKSRYVFSSSQFVPYKSGRELVVERLKRRRRKMMASLPRLEIKVVRR